MQNKAKMMRLSFNNRVRNGKEMLIMPVVGDGLSAKICEKSGVKAINVTGTAINSTYGKPDMGFADFYTLFNQAKEIVENVDIPVLCDVGTGHGFQANIARTTYSYEAIGVAGIYLDDGVWPKECGQMAKTMIAPSLEVTQRIRAAVAARKHPDFTIMVHSAARASYELDQAIDKFQAYIEAGADMLYVDKLTSVKELRQVARKIPNVPLFVNLNGLSQPIDYQELFKMGYAMSTFDNEGLYSRVAGEQAALKGEPFNFSMQNQAEGFKKIVDTDKMIELESNYAE
ncbi:isocitrate lyase/PEP mutase family protein [Lactobacillus xylocopicola]|uniref:Carboxyvinyl-carboxyphosphonate phosphorylmutase n=1 Tax=Lactobacillus xylocopicola TaxID=2976676 RepID=A0ABN6SJY4_9LACO|nr:isocitrate lyase/PEP mutase family protein [Lactobacillus xylocopicola]BDR59923.1 hypothetical protein KIM322_01840 [Lactobacillus xylocopicola]